MTALALRSANYVNAVSQLHGQVTREMWAPFYGKPVDQVPVGAITNGVHMETWVAADVGPALRSLPRLALARAQRRSGDLGADPRHPRRRAVEAAGRAAQVPDHLRARARPRALDSRARQRRPRRGRRHAAVAGVLTIGFARRFATYKRATLAVPRPGAPGARSSTNPRPAGADHLRRQGAPGATTAASAAAERLPLTPATRPSAAASPSSTTTTCTSRTTSSRAATCGSTRPPAARGERHQRHEGGGERCPQRQHPRRLVGRGLQRLERVPHRSGHRDRRPRRHGRGGCRRPTACSRRDRAGLLRARRAGRAAPLGRPDQEAIRTVGPRFCTRRMVKEYVEKMYEPATGHVDNRRVPGRLPRPPHRGRRLAVRWSDVERVGRRITMAALRCQGRLRATGEEKDGRDRWTRRLRSRNRRSRVRPQALHPCPQRRAVPRLPDRP